MKITDIITEAASPAQQAAIAISMKKAGKKPKTVDEDLTRRGFLRGLGAAVAGAAGSALAAMGGDQKLVMEPLNYLLINSDTAASVDVIVSVLEIIS